MTTNSCKAWILAARPKTLTGAAAPVIVGGAYALSLMRGKPQCVDTSIGHPWIPFLIALIFALIMQVEANFVNDYFDFRKGTDRDDRLGPERACAQGWVTPHAMRMALVITALLAFIVGLPLIVYGGWTMLIVGLACILFCWLYTTHLSYKGLGDVLVLVFFGLVPVVFTCYVMTRCVTPRLLLLGLAMGLATDCLLIVNNYRDIDQDRISGKRTLIVMTGRKVGLGLYLGCGLIAAVINLILIGWWGLLLLAYLALHIKTYLSMRRLTGKALNGVLGSTARNIFVFGLLTAIALIVV
jgi:1,4-dihydroxy-2-naphthoate octaprenyltransferase